MFVEAALTQRNSAALICIAESGCTRGRERDWKARISYSCKSVKRVRCRHRDYIVYRKLYQFYGRMGFLYWPCEPFVYYLYINIIFVIYVYTGCHRRNGPNFGRVFLMLNYTDITQNTHIQSWTVTEIMQEKFETLTAVTHLLMAKFILKLAGICGFSNVNICT